MRIEGALFRSSTARRIVAFFAAAALTPLAVVVALTWDLERSLQPGVDSAAAMAVPVSILVAAVVLALLVLFQASGFGIGVGFAGGHGWEENAGIPEQRT